MEENEIKTLLKEKYSLEGDLSLLEGYEDQNFLLKGAGGLKFLVKLSSAGTPLDLLEGQTEILKFLSSDSENNLCPVVHPNREGKFITSFEFGGSSRYIRVLDYLEGSLMSGGNHNLELHFDLGRLLGTLDDKLTAFSHPGLNRNNYAWELNSLESLGEFTKFIEDPRQKVLADYFISQYQNKVTPEMSSLRKSVIHGDANDNNILINQNKVCGIIDFGDAAYTCTVNEAAIALAYVMMNKKDPLIYGAEFIRGYHSEFPLDTMELNLLYYLVAGRLCTTVIMAARARAGNLGNKYALVSESSAWELLHKWIKINPIRARNTFYKACNLPESRPGNIKDSENKRFRHISRALSVSYDSPLKMEQGALQYLYDHHGDTYLDCVNNVCHVGHCHPGVVKSIQKQVARLNTNSRYLYDNLNEYAEKLTATLPDKLDVVFFTNSGSEATDLAVRIARTHTAARDIVVLSGAYHGNSTACIEMSPYKFEGKGGFPRPENTRIISIPDTYRGPYKSTDPDAGKKYAREILAIQKNLKNTDRGLAAFICESIVSCGGQVVLPTGYLQEVYSLVRGSGGLCIADEVQTGFGRVGSHFWAFELQDVIPDMVALGKPMGNGHPLAAVVTTREIAESFDNGMEYFNTYGGNPVACEAGKAVLEAIESGDLQRHAQITGEYFLNSLNKLKNEFSKIGDVRGHGLFLGIEFVKDRQTLEPAAEYASAIVNRMRERGFLLSTDGPLHNVIKIKPPLCFNRQNADDVVDNLRSTLQTLK